MSLPVKNRPTIGPSQGRGDSSTGANRKQTNHYLRPSMLQRIENARSVEELNVLRLLITAGLVNDQLGGREFAPDERTVQKWARAQWDRALQLILTAPTGSELCYRYNFMFTWPKAEVTRQALEFAFQLKAPALPSIAQELLAQGIIIQGITKL